MTVDSRQKISRTSSSRFWDTKLDGNRGSVLGDEKAILLQKIVGLEHWNSGIDGRV